MNAPGPHTTPRPLTSAVRLLLASAVLLLAGSILSACSAASAKAFTFCTDPTDPPAESYQVTTVGSKLTRTLVGSDIDIAHAVATQMGKTAQFTAVSFPDLLPALNSGKCDAVISFMNNTAERRQQASFVNYMAIGQSVMTKKSGLQVSGIDDLAGHTVAVASGTTESKFLAGYNSTHPARPIHVTTFDTENDAIYALDQGKADAYFGDTPVVLRAVANNAAFVLGPQLVEPTPIGIALRHGDDRIPAVQHAVDTLYQNGTMGSILSQWQLGRFALAPGTTQGG